MIVPKAILEGMKWMGEAYFNWRKGTDNQTRICRQNWRQEGRLKTTFTLMIKSRQDLQRSGALWPKGKSFVSALTR